MNSNENDERLRLFYRELRRRDEDSPPSFPDICHRAVNRAPERQPFGLAARLAIAAAFLALLCSSAVFSAKVGCRSPSSPANQVASLSEWQSPTEFLLRTPGEELLTTVPSLTECAVQTAEN